MNVVFAKTGAAAASPENDTEPATVPKGMDTFPSATITVFSRRSGELVDHDQRCSLAQDTASGSHIGQRIGAVADHEWCYVRAEGKAVSTPPTGIRPHAYHGSINRGPVEVHLCEGGITRVAQHAPIQKGPCDGSAIWNSGQVDVSRCWRRPEERRRAASQTDAGRYVVAGDSGCERLRKRIAWGNFRFLIQREGAV
jgi:hypothetical protein